MSSSFYQIADQYFTRFEHFNEQYALNPKPNESLKVVVVIPAFNEELEITLKSLANCYLQEPNLLELILVINQAEAEKTLTEKHKAQVEKWHNSLLENKLRVYCISALALGKKQAGVGLARKIGMDVALSRFAQIDHNGLIVCLDADCGVSKNYFEELLKLEKKEGVNGASLYYEHDFRLLNEPEKTRIIAYEIWLRYYHTALKWANYKHHFHTVGSSMLCRASAYAKIGGMNRRKAGEDFYFLHKLMPQGEYLSISNVCVYPSARVSTRVPFGTGRAMLEQKQETKDFEQLYNPKIFIHLKEFHSNLEQLHNGTFVNAFWYAFLQEFPKFKNGFNELVSRSKSSGRFLKNFWFWWDGFKVLKYVHFLESNYYPAVEADLALNNLFEIKGSKEVLLQQLRKFEK